MASRIYKTQGDGRWFPDDRRQLASLVDSFMEQAEVGLTGQRRILAGIVPHAGYEYSGPIAGYTYRALREAALQGNGPDTVVVLGFSHRVAFNGVAWLDADVVRTPIGDIDIDRKCIEGLLAAIPGSFGDVQHHMGEHSAENQFPFVQRALPGVPLVAGLIGGHHTPLRESLISALSNMAAMRSLCIIASTDLLHDADYERVVASDKRTLQMMESLDSEGLNKAWSYEEQVCCGMGPVLVAMEVARAMGCLRGRCLARGNSGDMDPRSRGHWVVGYGSVIYECE